MQEIVFFYETTIDVFSSLFLIIFGLFLIKTLRKQFEISFRKAFFLFFYHLIFLVIYVLFSYLNPSDSNTNYYKAISENIDYSLGTNVIEVLTWGVMIGSLLLLYLFDKNKLLSTKVFLSTVLIVVTSISSIFVLDKLQLDISSVDSVVNYIEKRHSYNQDGGGGIDISTMTLLEQLFTYVFRPLPFEAHSLFDLAASIENLFLLGLFLFFVKPYFNHCINPLFDKNLIFIYSFVIITSIYLAMTTANLGISVRQKWMFMLFLIYILFLYIAGERKVEKSLYKEMICEK
ncbi:hypothetical protein ACOTVP_05680 [Aliarcobacter butzleri]|uniref:Uncharacterized protein n=1 Tax=Aliarcobacter butzleri TaxID=28197 RepID=A0AAW6VNK7_9BACT|nr:hypothetical protein [Aliarcobacter butzleri]MDK2062603.1 hypothetical protein [Aliarcobacter butzleri]MDK2070738.1 hypothetical protein [Aliarcobacter butzleri]